MVLPDRYTNTEKKRMGSHKEHDMKYFCCLSSNDGMERWNSKCYRTRVKWFKVQRQKEE
ncbi:hypothetical protein AVEN_181676-1, partial [Araneus ventricosus]